MNAPPTPVPPEGALLDHLLGEGDPARRAALDRAVAADPVLARERAALEALLAVEHSAHEPALDAGAAARIAARVRDRVHREEDRPVREGASRASRWARFLAVSIAAHALLLAFVAWRMPARGEAPPSRGERVARVEPSEDAWDGSEGSETESEPFATLEPPAMPDLARPGFAPGLPPLEVPEDPLPAERVLADAPLALEPPAGAEATDVLAFPRASARAMALRRSSKAKETLLGSAHFAVGTLERVRRGLDAIASRQRPDGTFEPAAGRSVLYATAVAVLPFLGDGESTAAGPHRAEVAKAVRWLRAHAAQAATPAERGAAALALAEDAMLSYGTLTPVEAQARRTELAALARSLPSPSESGDPAASIWISLARRALVRAGVAAPGVETPSSWVALAAFPGAADDPSAALVQGTAALLGDRGADVVRRFGEGSQALADKLGTTGLVREGASTGERIESTALILLVLEVVFRTY